MFKDITIYNLNCFQEEQYRCIHQQFHVLEVIFHRSNFEFIHLGEVYECILSFHALSVLTFLELQFYLVLLYEPSGFYVIGSSDKRALTSGIDVSVVRALNEPFSCHGMKMK